MVDFGTYKEIHGDSATYRRSYGLDTLDDTPESEQMKPKEMKTDTPPSTPEIFVFPNMIPAYNMRSKKCSKY